MARLVVELAWDEEGRADKWLVPSDSHRGYWVVVHKVPGKSLVCSCPAPKGCHHIDAVARLEQEAVA